MRKTALQRHQSKSAVKCHRRVRQKTAIITPLFYFKIAVITAALFLFAQVIFYSAAKQRTLGVSTYYDLDKVAALINHERLKYGLMTLQSNSKLAQASLAKGENMLAEDYWAHDSVTGKKPWDFIDQVGYQYLTAGENLARDFSSEEEMVAAWMASPTHRANILNPRYRELGLATVDGELAGEQVVLVVNMFGNPATPFISNQTPETPVPATAVQNDTDNTALFTSGTVLGKRQPAFLGGVDIVALIFSAIILFILMMIIYKIFFPRRRVLKLDTRATIKSAERSL